MEAGPAADVTARPKHPYSVALTAAAPVPRPGEQARRRAARRASTGQASTGQASTGTGQWNTSAEQASAGIDQRSAGCPFAPRCPAATDVCRAQRPVPRQLEGRVVACHHAR